MTVRIGKSELILSVFAYDCEHAYLSPEKYRSGKYRIARMPMRGLHEGKCPFKWDEGELGARNATSSGSPSPHRLPEKINFLPINSVDGRATAGARSGTGSSRKRGEHQDALQQTLFWLLHKAGLNVCDGNSLKRQDRMDQLIAVLNKTMICDSINLKSVTWWSYKAITDGWVQNRFDSLRSRWPNKKQLQGYLILTAEKVDTSNQTLHDPFGNILTVDVPLNVYGRAGELSAPYLAIVLVVEDKGRLRLLRNYVHPIATLSDLLIVDSSLERDASRVLEQFAKAVNSKKPGGFRVLKPLEDYVVRDAGCRPDFIVEDMIANRTMVVETMGSNDSDYLERKRSTHTLMRDVGELFLDERADVPKDEADERLRKALWRWYFKAHKG